MTPINNDDLTNIDFDTVKTGFEAQRVSFDDLVRANLPQLSVGIKEFLGTQTADFPTLKKGLLSILESAKQPYAESNFKSEMQYAKQYRDVYKVLEKIHLVNPVDGKPILNRLGVSILESYLENYAPSFKTKFVENHFTKEKSKQKIQKNLFNLE